MSEVHGLSAVVPRTDQTPVAQSLSHAITYATVAALAESNFAQIDGFDDPVELCAVSVVESLPCVASSQISVEEITRNLLALHSI